MKFRCYLLSLSLLTLAVVEMHLIRSRCGVGGLSGLVSRKRVCAVRLPTNQSPSTLVVRQLNHVGNLLDPPYQFGITALACSTQQSSSMALSILRPQNWRSRFSTMLNASSSLFPSNLDTMSTSFYRTEFEYAFFEGRCTIVRLEEVPTDQPDAMLTHDSLYWAEKRLVSENDGGARRPHWITRVLHPKEVELGLTSLQSPKALRSFLMGRLAIRRALWSELWRWQRQEYQSESNKSSCTLGDEYPFLSIFDPILKDDHGRPCIPAGFVGSISHKGPVAGALVQQLEQGVSRTQFGVGVDIEEATRPGRTSIARKVLTKDEIDSLGRLQTVSWEEEVMLRFSIKESLYKAMHPLICQYVGFQEAAVQPHDNGTATISLFFHSGAHEKFANYTAHWTRYGNYFVTSASALLTNPPQIECPV